MTEAETTFDSPIGMFMRIHGTALGYRRHYDTTFDHMLDEHRVRRQTLEHEAITGPITTLVCQWCGEYYDESRGGCAELRRRAIMFSALPGYDGERWLP